MTTQTTASELYATADHAAALADEVEERMLAASQVGDTVTALHMRSELKRLLNRADILRYRALCAEQD